MPPKTRTTRAAAAAAAQKTLHSFGTASKAAGRVAGKNALKNVTNKEVVEEVGECITVRTSVEVVIEMPAKATPRKKVAAKVTKVAKGTPRTRKAKVVEEVEEEVVEVKEVEKVVELKEVEEVVEEKEVEEVVELKEVEEVVEVKEIEEVEIEEVEPALEKAPTEDAPIAEEPTPTPMPTLEPEIEPEVERKMVQLAPPPATPAKTPKRTRKAPAKTPSKTPSKTPASRKRKAASPSPPPTPTAAVSITALLNTLTPADDDDLDLLPTTPVQKRTRLSSPTAPLPSLLAPFPPLYASFLTAYTLHTSLLPHGVYPSFTTLQPTLQRLLPHTPITLPLLRQLFSLATSFKLIDMGPTRGVHIKSLSPLTSPESLKREFLAHLQTLDDAYVLKEAGIQPHRHLATVNHVLGKKTRDIREFLAKPTKPSMASIPKSGDAATRTMGLAERIRAKAAAAAEGKLSDEDILRGAAEGRVEEVKGVLRGLRSRERGGSVGLKRVVEVVRESVKMPVDREVAEWAVRICAEREAWVSVCKAGEVEGVVFKAEEKKVVNRFL